MHPFSVGLRIAFPPFSRNLSTMKTKPAASSSPKPARRTRKDKKAAFERFAAEFGPKPGEKPGKLKAVEFLIKLRRGEA
jgi:hypothetical protein